MTTLGILRIGLTDFPLTIELSSFIGGSWLVFAARSERGHLRTQCLQGDAVLHLLLSLVLSIFLLLLCGPVLLCSVSFFFC